jgi:hypothetical protein
MKRALLAATAIVFTSLSSTIATPAFADDGDDIILNPVTLDNPDGPPLTAQEVCDEALRPAAASGFQTEPTSSTDSGWVNDGLPIRGDNVGAAVPTGTPSSSFVILTGGYFRNGGSPNVWGHGVATLTYPNSTQEYEQSQNQVDTVTVSCRVWKYVGENSPNGPHLVQPPGLQTTNNVSVGHQNIELPNGFDYNAGPVTLTGQEVYALICISPGKKGGVWTGKNGFNAALCPSANTAAGGTIPSGNIPQI